MSKRHVTASDMRRRSRRIDINITAAIRESNHVASLNPGMTPLYAAKMLRTVSYTSIAHLSERHFEMLIDGFEQQQAEEDLRLEREAEDQERVLLRIEYMLQ